MQKNKLGEKQTSSMGLERSTNVFFSAFLALLNARHETCHLRAQSTRSGSVDPRTQQQLFALWLRPVGAVQQQPVESCARWFFCRDPLRLLVY